MYLFVALLSGMLIAAQSSCSGLMFPVLGTIGVACLSQTLNAISIVFCQGIAQKRLPSLKGMPPKAALGGFFGIFAVGLTGLCSALLGTAITVCLSVAGQLVSSAVIDQFGWLGAERIPFKKKRLPGFFVILLGVFLINFSGTTGLGQEAGAFPLLLLALAAGVFTVFTRMFSFYACQKIGLLNGSFSNVIIGAVAAFVLYLFMNGFHLSLHLFFQISPVAYLTGICGAGACILNTIVYKRLKIFKATVLIIAGQITMGILLDFAAAGGISAGKLLGIGVICLGIGLDKNISSREQK